MTGAPGLALRRAGEPHPDAGTLPLYVSQWTLVGNTPVESAIASEGLSLLTVPMAGCMVSFGG